MRWKSFLLRPAPQRRDPEEFRAYTKSWLRPAEMEPAARFRVWATDDPPPSHSVPSSVAGKVAASFGPECFDRFHHAVLEAYFAGNRDISDRDVLVAVAIEAGLDGAAFGDRMTAQGDGFEQQVFADHTRALELGINAVPSVVVADRYLVPGAVETALYRRIIEELQGAA